MLVKKHKLTTHTDQMNGVKGVDLFLGAKVGTKDTLSNKDFLNGKGGIDTIQASINSKSLTPRLGLLPIFRTRG